MVCSLSCAFLVSIGDRDFAPADGYWSARISHRIRFNRGCLRGQDTCRLRNHDIGRGRIQKRPALDCLSGKVFPIPPSKLCPPLANCCRRMALFAPPSVGISAAGSSGTSIAAATMATAVLAKMVALFRSELLWHRSLHLLHLCHRPAPAIRLRRWQSRLVCCDHQSLLFGANVGARVTRTAFAALSDAMTIWFRINSQIQTQRAASHHSTGVEARNSSLMRLLGV